MSDSIRYREEDRGGGFHGMCILPVRVKIVFFFLFINVIANSIRTHLLLIGDEKKVVLAPRYIPSDF